jgi:hypothetical protein
MTKSSKRKSDEYKNSPNKKNRNDSDVEMPPSLVFPAIDSSWISASKTRNFMLKDPLLDWLEMYGKSKGFFPDSINQTPKKRELNFGLFIMNKGIEFEKLIVSQLKDIHADDFKEVKSFERDFNLKIKQQVSQTYNFMKSGVKIIYQGIVYNPLNKTWGYPDLIVRSDYINSLCEQRVISEAKSKKGCSFSPDWHYRIVDIKFSTLKMKSDGKCLLNSGSVRPYKAQTLIYNRAIGFMQNLIPRKAYILGRGWNTSKQSSMKPLDKFGVVDFVGDDSEIEQDVDSCLEWISKLKKEGSNWNIYPSPSTPELYPNMCNESNGDWSNSKKKIAHDLSEISLVWNCGVEDRSICHENKVFSWKDPLCNSSLMKKGGKVNPQVIDKILETNRGDYTFFIDKTEKEFINWKKDESCVSFFIDFETVSNINNLRATDDDGNIFLIGSLRDGSLRDGSLRDGEEDDFSSFVSSRLTFRDETKIIQDFLESCFKICVERKSSKCRFYHYSFSEFSSFKGALKKYNIALPVDIEIEWIDLLDVVKRLKFIVKGALDFSLKSLVGALFSHGLIKTSYDDSEISNGSLAMISCFKCDEEAMKRGGKMIDFDGMKEIVKYNKIDCVVLRELRDLLERLVLE